MLRPLRLMLLFCAALLLSDAPPRVAHAQVCATNLGCAADLVCDRAFLGLIGSCKVARCNGDASCAVTRRITVCVEGLCRATCASDSGCPIGLGCQRLPDRAVGACIVASSSGSGGPQPGGGSRAGEGQPCGPREFGGGVIKSVGCAHGLHCQNRRCMRLTQ
jgi:hypothetical protein